MPSSKQAFSVGALAPHSSKEPWQVEKGLLIFQSPHVNPYFIFNVQACALYCKSENSEGWENPEGVVFPDGTWSVNFL